MTKNPPTNSNSQPPAAEITDLNLGIKQQLLAHKPLGQKLITPKFLSPLGATKLSNFDSSNNQSIKKTPTASQQPKQTSTVIQVKSEKTASKTAFVQPENAQKNSHEKTEIPQLTTALSKISTFQPLVQPSELISSTVANEIDSVNVPHSISHTPVHHIQKTPERNIPNSWSSIAELVGEIPVDSINPTTIVQPLTEKKPWDNQLNSLAFTKLQHHKIAKKTDFSKIEPSNQVIQAYNSFENSTSSETISKNELENMETLAREIYKMLKQRLEIECERRGNNYSGRLRW